MTIIQVTAKELKDLDPREFDRQYYKWLEHAASYDWWDYIYDEFKERMDKLGVEIYDIEFDGHHGWSAAIDARMNFSDLIVALGLKETYLPLWLDACNYGGCVVFKPSNRSATQRISTIDYYPGQCPPWGVFESLPQETWDEMLNDQYDAEDWERLALDWLESYLGDLATQLEQEYDYRTSEEEFLEVCDLNDVMFDLEVDDEI